MQKLAEKIKVDFLLAVRDTFYPYLLPYFFNLAGKIITSLSVVFCCYNYLLPAKFQIPIDSACTIFGIIMIFGMGIMALSREKEESKKIKEARELSLVMGACMTFFLLLFGTCFHFRGVSIFQFWKYLFEGPLPPALDTTKILLKLTFTFLLCRSILFFIYMIEDSDDDDPPTVKTKPRKPVNAEA